MLIDSQYINANYPICLKKDFLLNLVATAKNPCNMNYL